MQLSETSKKFSEVLMEILVRTPSRYGKLMIIDFETKNNWASVCAKDCDKMTSGDCETHYKALRKKWEGE